MFGRRRGRPWYNDNWRASTFIKVWMMIANRFKDNPLTGYDIHNEPRRPPSAGR